MYRWIRTGQISKGRAPQAIGWAKEVSAFAQSKLGTPEIKVFLDVFGQTGTIRWEVEYKDLATFETVQTKVMESPEYWQHVAKAEADELFIDGSFNDYLLKEV